MIKLLLLAVIPFMTEHRTVAPKTEVSTNFYGSVTGIVDKAYVEGLGIEPVDTQAVIKASNDYTDSATGAIRRVDGYAKMLPKYLWCKDFYDSYTNDAAWYYAQPQDYGQCSAMRDGNFLYRNLDWKFNDAADVIVRMFSGEGRFASIGVANCGTNLTEEIITSGKPSRYYKCLPGHTTDGINENGVAVEVNVVDGDLDYWDNPNGDIHPLGAVRWVLDHATNALHAAMELSMRIKFPEGWTQNFHWMIADKDATYIVEDGTNYLVTGKAVMTNFRLYPAPVFGPGWERYKLLSTNATANIKDVWFTRAYSPDTDWVSEFADSEEMNAAKIAWDNGKGKESHRGEHIGNKWWWQTVHTSVYDITNRTLRVTVQETDDWYTFAVPSAGGVKPEAVREIVEPMIGAATNALDKAKREKDDLNVYEKAGVGDDWTWTSENQGLLSALKINTAKPSKHQYDGFWWCDMISEDGWYAPQPADSVNDGEYIIAFTFHNTNTGEDAGATATRSFELHPVTGDFLAKESQLADKIGKDGGTVGYYSDDYSQVFRGLDLLKFVEDFADPKTMREILSGYVSRSRQEDPVNETMYGKLSALGGLYVPAWGLYESGDARYPFLPRYLDSLDWRTTGNRTLADYGITNGATKIELASKQDALPYPTNAIPASVITGLDAKIDQSVSANLNTYIDGETGVEYVGKFYDGSLYYVPTGNVFPPND